MPQSGESGQIRFARVRRAVHLLAMAHHSPLDDPATSAHAWGRFRRQLRITGWLTLGLEFVVLSLLFAAYGPVSIHLYIGMALAIALTMFLVSGLMGLAFLSSGTGHDAAVADQSEFDKRR
jgi:hypothetical protein